MPTDHNLWRERRAEAESNRGPSAYQPDALPLGHTGSLESWCNVILLIPGETFFFFFFFFFLIYAVIDEDEDDKWWCYGGPFRFWDYLTGPQTTLTVTIIPVLTRPGNCGTCSVGQVIRATPSKTHPLSGWSSAVWFQPSHWAHSTPSSG